MVDLKFSVSIHILTALAFNKNEQGRLTTSEELAKGLRTNPAVVRRMIARLAEAGLVKSYKGKSGGVELAKSPLSITLRDIYAASSEKTLIRSSTKKPQKQCPVSCAMAHLMADIISGVETSTLSYLGQFTLADLTLKVPANFESGSAFNALPLSRLAGTFLLWVF